MIIFKHKLDFFHRMSLETILHCFLFSLFLCEYDIIIHILIKIVKNEYVLRELIC